MALEKMDSLKARVEVFWYKEYVSRLWITCPTASLISFGKTLRYICYFHLGEVKGYLVGRMNPLVPNIIGDSATTRVIMRYSLNGHIKGNIKFWEI